MKISDSVYEKYQKHLSTYLIEGWTKDIHCIQSIEVDADRIVALIDVSDPYYPIEEYYFTTVQAVPLLYQLSILYACYNDFAQKPGDVYLRELNMECRRMIQKLEGIRFEANLVNKRRLKDWMYYVLDYKFEQAFRGQLRYAVPLATPD